MSTTSSSQTDLVHIDNTHIHKACRALFHELYHKPARTYQNQLIDLCQANAAANGREVTKHDKYYIRHDNHDWIPDTWSAYSSHYLSVHSTLQDKFEKLARRITDLQKRERKLSGFINTYLCFVYDVNQLKNDFGHALFTVMKPHLVFTRLDSDTVARRQEIFADFMHGKQDMLEELRFQRVRNQLEQGYGS